ncbi:hypothetical protein GCM10022294_14120 [Dietzia aurantiaca]|uniref:Uncharacterized protein n=1 Tax=Dietzia aurantiaca TaxID=983873 RepID=A0ABV9PRX4_9ACTN
MTVQELQSRAHLTRSWTEVCAGEHGVGPVRQSGGRGGRPASALPSVASRTRPMVRSKGRRAGGAVDTDRVRPVAARRSAQGRGVAFDRSPARARSTSAAPVAPGRRVVVRSAGSVRACEVQAPAPAGVVDDVPTWALVVCGVLFGIAMLLALAFLGGPAYA